MTIVMIKMNAMMVHIAALEMPSAITHMAHIIVFVNLDSRVMHSIVQTLMNACLVHVV